MIPKRGEDVDDSLALDEKRRQVLAALLRNRGIVQLRRDLRAARVDALDVSGNVGLAVCRRIVDRHKGVITAKSKPGEGATFVVTLPVRHPEKDKSPA